MRWFLLVCCGFGVGWCWVWGLGFWVPWCVVGLLSCIVDGFCDIARCCGVGLVVGGGVLLISFCCCGW